MSSELEQERVGFLQPSTISGDNLIHTSENEHHVSDHIDVSANDWSYIFQADGNATIGTLSDAGDTVENIDMHLPPTHSPRTLSTPVAGLLLNQLSSSMSGNKTFDYSLNPLQQTKRLMDNALKPSMEVTLNNVRVINGENHPTNAFIECNAGTYISAVKPALEAVSVGWRHDLTGVTISCIDSIERSDQSGRHVSTKLTFMLMMDTSAKITLHFYHTSNTIQVQGSTIMPEGISSAAWLVKYFLEPLAQSFIATNSDTITNINSSIINSGQMSCDSCNENINPSANVPKDKPLVCDKCGKVSHKKCTDRRRITQNWSKKPWFCQPCILGQTTQPRLPQQEPSSIQTLPQVTSRQEDNSISADRPETHLEDVAILKIVNNPLNTSLNPLAKDFLPSSIIPPVTVHPAPLIKFPNNSSRQKSSNLALDPKDSEK